MPRLEDSSSVSLNRVIPRLSVVIGRSLLYLILALIAVLGVWASATRINVVINADGRLVPRDESQRLSIPQGGIISSIFVKVGETIGAAQPIMEVDSFRETADVARVSHEIQEARDEETRYLKHARDLQTAESYIEEELASARQVMKLLTEEATALAEGYRTGAVSLFELQAKEREAAEAKGKVAELESNLAGSSDDSEDNRRLALETLEKIKALEA